ncbi:MAG: putative DNA-binding domain-containing protein [Nevskia sp.]|nr:putative DNA-binding domain-containing protein [Nevskia sp.]
MAEDSLQAQQARFAAHLRDPDANPPPDDVAPERMAVYRRLFFNNIETLLAKAFPVVRRILADEHWLALVRDFYARHDARTPLFRKLAEAFVDWLADGRGEHAGDPPFLAQLAHYEWVELALSTAEDPPPATLLAHPNGDLLAAPPIISPLCWTLAYDWPVQRIGPDFQPTQPGAAQTFLVVHRNRLDEVKFVEVNAVTARLLTLAEQQPEASGYTLLEQIAEELQHPEVDDVVSAGAEILEGLRERGIVLGTRLS